MNLRLQQMLKLHRLYEPAGDGGSDAGGTGSGAGAAGDGDAGTEAQSGEAGEGAGAAGDASGSKAQGEADAGAGDKSGQAPSITDADAKLLKDVMKHKDRAKELERELQAAREKLSAYDGLDPSKARELLEKEQEAERKAAEARGDYDRLVAQMGERHKNDMARVAAELDTERSTRRTLEQRIADLTVGNAFATSQFVSTDLTLTPTKARVVYGAHFDYVDGKVVGYDKPAGASDRTPLVDAQGETLGFEDALRALIEKDPDRDQLIRTKAKSGAASSTTTPKGASKAVQAAQAAVSSKLTGAEKIAAGLKALAKS